MLDTLRILAINSLNNTLELRKSNQEVCWKLRYNLDGFELIDKFQSETMTVTDKDPVTFEGTFNDNSYFKLILVPDDTFIARGSLYRGIKNHLQLVHNLFLHKFKTTSLNIGSSDCTLVLALLIPELRALLQDWGNVKKINFILGGLKNNSDFRQVLRWSDYSTVKVKELLDHCEDKIPSQISFTENFTIITGRKTGVFNYEIFDRLLVAMSQILYAQSIRDSKF